MDDLAVHPDRRAARRKDAELPGSPHQAGDERGDAGDEVLAVVEDDELGALRQASFHGLGEVDADVAGTSEGGGQLTHHVGRRVSREASSHIHTPSKSPASRRATSRASRVLPVPPGPMSVTRPGEPRRAVTAAVRSGRGTKLVSSGGRLPTRPDRAPTSPTGPGGPGTTSSWRRMAPSRAEKLGARHDAQLVAEQRSQALVGAQGVGLPPAQVERPHELAPESFPERMVGDGRLGVEDDAGRLTEGEPRLQPALDDIDPQLFQAHGFRAGPARVGDLGEGGPPPAGEALAEESGRPAGVALAEVRSPRRRLLLERGDIELAGRHGEDVGAVAVTEALRSEGAPQQRDVALQRRGGARGEDSLPQVLLQPAGGHRAVGGDEEAHEQAPPELAVHADLAAGARHPRRAEQAEGESTHAVPDRRLALLDRLVTRSLPGPAATVAPAVLPRPAQGTRRAGR